MIPYPKTSAPALLMLGLCVAVSVALAAEGGTKPAAPAASRAVAAYTPDGRLQRPKDYREWIFLSSGIDMSYSEKPGMAMHSMFDNVFVDPVAYRVFVETGTWPDGTVLVMEARGAAGKGSINRRGHYQTNELMGFEMHVKDSARFPGGWAFFAFDGDQPAQQLPAQAACYACHRQHGAVDTTFVQFYPTLLDIATKRGTLSPAYVAESRQAGSPARHP